MRYFKIIIYRGIFFFNTLFFATSRTWGSYILWSLLFILCFISFSSTYGDNLGHVGFDGKYFTNLRIDVLSNERSKGKLKIVLQLTFTLLFSINHSVSPKRLKLVNQTSTIHPLHSLFATQPPPTVINYI